MGTTFVIYTTKVLALVPIHYFKIYLLKFVFVLSLPYDLNRRPLKTIMEVSEVNGVYDIVVKIASQTLDDLKVAITRHIRTIDTIRSTMTLIVIE